MKKKEDKQKDVESLRQELEQAQHLFVAGFEKLKVAQDFELRKAVRAAGGKYRVIKNNLAEKAAEGTPARGSAARVCAGMTSLAYTDGRSGGAGQGADGLRQDQPDASRSRPGMVEGRVIDIQADQRTGQHAVARKRCSRSCCS